MMQTESSFLTELARQVRYSTINFLESAPDDALTFAPIGTSNHIIWHAGHSIWVQDAICIKLLAGGSRLPDAWAESFGMECRPVKETNDWPAKSQLLTMMETQLQEITELLNSTSMEKLTQVADKSRGEASIAGRIIHGFHDEARHSGEMYLLLKMARNR